MNTSLNAVAKTALKAKPAAVWKALTDPAIIKQYFFGVDVETDWKEGSSIVYKGEWKGKKFEDKGEILVFQPEKLLKTTHWSPLSGTEDKPENYHTVSYALTAVDDGTELTITQENNATEKEKDHSEQNWKMMLDGMKKVLET